MKAKSIWSDFRDDDNYIVELEDGRLARIPRIHISTESDLLPYEGEHPRRRAGIVSAGIKAFNSLGIERAAP